VAGNLRLTCAVVRARDLFPRSGSSVRPRRRHGADAAVSTALSPCTYTRAVASARRSRRPSESDEPSRGVFPQAPRATGRSVGHPSGGVPGGGAAVGAAGSPTGGRDPRQGGIGHSFMSVGLARERERSRLLRSLQGRSGGWGRSVRTCRRDTEKSGHPWSRKKRKISIQLV